MERKFKILDSEYGADLGRNQAVFGSSQISGFLAVASKGEYDMAIINQTISHRMAISRNSSKYCDCSTAVFVSTAKRSFPKLKFIKSYLRSSMSQDHSSNLSLISIEYETMEKIDFDQITSNFASAKARKIKIC